VIRDYSKMYNLVCHMRRRWAASIRGFDARVERMRRSGEFGRAVGGRRTEQPRLPGRTGGYDGFEWVEVAISPPAAPLKTRIAENLDAGRGAFITEARFASP
jgi:hypothetical protein